MFLAFCLFTFTCKYCFENFREKTHSGENGSVKRKRIRDAALSIFFYLFTFAA